DEAGPDSINANAFGGIFDCRRLGETHNAVFRRDIGARTRKTVRAEDRRHIDDGAAACLEHRGDFITHAVEHAAEIYIDDLAPAVGRVITGEFRSAANARVVDGQV